MHPEVQILEKEVYSYLEQGDISSALSKLSEAIHSYSKDLNRLKSRNDSIESEREQLSREIVQGSYLQGGDLIPGPEVQPQKDKSNALWDEQWKNMDEIRQLETIIPKLTPYYETLRTYAESFDSSIKNKDLAQWYKVGTPNPTSKEQMRTLLLRSFEKWNVWRNVYPKIRIDFSGLSFSGAIHHKANLIDVILHKAKFIRMNLQRTTLSGVDLSGANLSGANLSGANLSGANLDGANLSEANLSEANLDGANLSEADLSKAKLDKATFVGASLKRASLSGADLSGTNLERVDFNRSDLSGATLVGACLKRADLSRATFPLANLKKADLSGANLSRADFSEADLTDVKLDNADFSKTIFDNTIIVKVDLSQAKGLETIIHRQHSIIDINTIYRSKDRISKVFLEKTGVHPDIIRWQQNLHTRPTVFLSYSRKDEKEKDQLLTHLSVLEKINLIEIWHDALISPGADWKQEIKNAISDATVVILLVTANFLSSDFILAEEIPQFLERQQSDDNLIIFPIIARECAWQRVGWLAGMQVRPKGGKPVWRGQNNEVDVELTIIADEVTEVIIKSRLPG